MRSLSIFEISRDKKDNLLFLKLVINFDLNFICIGNYLSGQKITSLNIIVLTELIICLTVSNVILELKISRFFLICVIF